jgi:hypothetical protein
VDAIGLGGKQILVGKPSDSPVELFDPLVEEARPSGPAKK